MEIHRTYHIWSTGTHSVHMLSGRVWADKDKCPRPHPSKLSMAFPCHGFSFSPVISPDQEERRQSYKLASPGVLIVRFLVREPGAPAASLPGHTMRRLTDYTPQPLICFEAGVNRQVMRAVRVTHGSSWSLSSLLLETLAFIFSSTSFLYLYMLLQLCINICDSQFYNSGFSFWIFLVNSSIAYIVLILWFFWSGILIFPVHLLIIINVRVTNQ